MRKLAWLLLLLLTLAGWSDPSPNIYLRNRAVQGHQVGGEVYVQSGELPHYLSPAEMKRVKVEAGHVLVDGQPVGDLDDTQAVPLVSLVKALGYDVRTNRTSGTVDLTPPAAMVINTGPAEVVAGNEKSRQEYQIAAHRMKTILASAPICDDPEIIARINKVGGKVVQVCPLSGIPWHFYVIDTPIPNAACVGEGHVFVNRGLLDLGISDDELAGVLGHEIAHGVRRHVFRRLDLVRDLNNLLNDYEVLRKEIYNLGSGRPSQTLQNRVNAYESSRKTLQYKLDNLMVYSRQDEEEADVLGLRYAVAAGYSPNGLGDCLTKLQNSMIQQFGVGVLRDDMSHPPVKRRLEILDRVRTSWNL